MDGTVDPQAFRTAYDQLCQTYRAIDDFRAKLLGFLPVVTGGGLLVVAGKSDSLGQGLLRPAGIFGLVVTFGLFSLEIFGIRKCHASVACGKSLETALGLRAPSPAQILGPSTPAGQFQSRPRSVLGRVNEPFAAAVIYPAAMAAWVYLAFYYTKPGLGGWMALAVFLGGFAATLAFDHRLQQEAAEEAAAPYSPEEGFPAPLQAPEPSVGWSGE